MLSLSKLMVATPSNIVKNSRSVRARIMRSVIDIDEVGRHKKVIMQARDTDGVRHLIYRFYKPNYKNLARSPAYVHCSCPYFLYYLEVAVTARGSSDVVNSNGAYPKVRNPDMRPYLCKHLFAASRSAMRSKAKELKRAANVDEAELRHLLNMLKDVIP